MPKGYLSLVLHAHLPYVRHPEDGYLEEKWLYEAITETYIPLIRIFENLVNDGINFRITISLSPPLIAMLTDSLLQQKYLKHLEKLRELAAREVSRTKKEQPEVHQCALMYQNMFENAYKTFHYDYRDNLITAFRRFQDFGVLEVITCAGTHGYLPLLGIHRETTRAQIRTATDYYREHFGKNPEGIWLPECAYNPGDDELLKEAGIKYFFLDTHGLLFAVPRPKYGIYAPVVCPGGVAAFGRDMESSKQVWSANEGYPGDFDYREFYRDIGYDLDIDYIAPYIHHQGIRTDTGMKYYRITGKKTEHKQPYIPHNAREKAAIHAGNFMFNREKQIEYLARHMDRPPVVVSPYDAELFGHWWFEGPMWLEFLIRKITFDQNIIQLKTPSDYLEEISVNQPCRPPMSSWGYRGYNEVWLEGSNDWIYRHLHNSAERMIELANSFGPTEGLTRRALNQAARELLLAQASDWAFIMKTGTMVDYAKRRTTEHVSKFFKLYKDLKSGDIDETWLKELEGNDNIFPNINYEVYQSV